MTFPAKDNIIKRKSVRTFDGNPLSVEDREKLQACIDSIGEPFGVPVDLRLLEAKDHGLSSPVILGEHTYLAGKVKRQENCEIAFGYAFEKVCLYAQSLGIGTVMLAASLSRSAFEKAMDVQAGEVLPVASPVGYLAAKRSLRETIMRRGIKADTRMEFGQLYFVQGFDRPLRREDAGDLAEALEMVRWAPSAANKQPWRIVLDGGRAHFYEAKTMKENALGDVQKVDMGIAMVHWELALAEDGITGRFVKADPGIEAPAGTEYIMTFERKAE